MTLVTVLGYHGPAFALVISFLSIFNWCKQMELPVCVRWFF